MSAVDTLANFIPYGNLVLGGIETIGSLMGLNKLSKEATPRYQMTPEEKSSMIRADMRSKQGFSNAENAAWSQNLARGQSTGYQKAVDRAPNLAQSLLSGINYTNIGAINQHAGQDAQLHQQNIRYADTFAQQTQNLANMNTQTDLGIQQQTAQAYGGGLKSGLGNIANSFNLAQALKFYAGGSGQPSGSDKPFIAPTDWGKQNQFIAPTDWIG